MLWQTDNAIWSNQPTYGSVPSTSVFIVVVVVYSGVVREQNITPSKSVFINPYSLINLQLAPFSDTFNPSSSLHSSWSMERTAHTDLRETRQTHSPALSPITQFVIFTIFTITACIFSYSLSISFWTQDLAFPFLLWPTYLPTGLIAPTLGPSNVFTLLNGWICLHGVLD